MVGSLAITTPTLADPSGMIVSGLVGVFGGRGQTATDTLNGVTIRTSRSVEVSPDRAWEFLGYQLGELDA